MHNSGFASCMILQKIRYTPKNSFYLKKHLQEPFLNIA